MTAIPFTKLVGSGNDFVLVDDREGGLARQGVAFEELARRWCDRHRGIGADGVLVLGTSGRGDVQMRVFNPDGTEAASCGNGLMCAAFAWRAWTGAGTVRVETGGGVVEARVQGTNGGSGQVALGFPDPEGIRLRMAMTVQGTALELHGVNTGVPHAVVFRDRLGDVDVDAWGAAVRHHPAFRPEGTNVNFVAVAGPRTLRLRTYERGVEAETLACGTGAVASAVIGAVLGRVAPPVEVLTAGGEVLRVAFVQEGERVRQVVLEGSVRLVYEGRTVHV